MGAGVCFDNGYDFGPSCCNGLPYCRRCLPCEARKFHALVLSTFGAVQAVLLSECNFPRLVYAVVAVSVLLFLLAVRCRAADEYFVLIVVGLGVTLSYM